LPIGIFEHFLLLDAATVAGYEPGILVVDLLAIQEKLAYDALKKEDQKAASQGLLLPLKLELTPTDAKALELHLPLLERMGFSLAPLGLHVGLHVFSVDAIPSFLLEAQVKDAILAVLSGEDKIRALARFARRQKKTFVLQEALALWTKVKGENHRSLTAYLSRDALSKLFG
jgi:DNA mismatch repair ATPase MutL